MRTYPVPFNEEARIQAVHNVPGLTKTNHAIFDSLCDAAAVLLGCPIAHISVVEEETQWYKSVIGIELPEMPKDNSFCTHTIMSDKPMVIPDLSVDPKFKDHPMVREGGPGARFYAGVPLTLSSGYRFGSLCALDLVPHETPSEKVLEVLEHLGRSVVAALEKAPAEDANRQTRKGQAAFLQLVGHELRTPLTVISGGLTLLQHKLDDETCKRLAHSPMVSATHLGSLIETVLEFSSLETGELQLDETACDLGRFLLELAEQHVPTALQAGKAVQVVTPSSETSVIFDRNHIGTCIIALLLNAVQHGGDKIRLYCTSDDDHHLEICVEDNGMISDHVDLSELYRPFVVGEDIEQRGSRGGLGLGLPLTRKLVELHGGEFEIEQSRSATIARIRLPKWRATPQ